MQMQVQKNISVNSAIYGIYRLLLISFALFTLYFAQTIVIPLTIAALLTFLLSPLVTRLEKWIGRVFAILIVVLVVFSILGFVGYVFTRQLIQFGTDLPNYSENIQKKFESFHFPNYEIFSEFGQTIDKFKETLFGPTITPIGSPAPVTEVKLIDLSSYITDLIQTIFGSIFHLLAATGIVLLLVIFMLLNKEDLRSRFIKLLGRGRISSTTGAMEDAGERVSQYLYRQFVVNAGFGISVGLGLYLIGIPNVVLWGFLAAILRFIPYIGPWIAATLPIALSFIITDSWITPLLTFTFFVVLEILTAYAIEPFYYGAGTGVSSFALIIAAIFWTWLWGPIGLLLSTPLTVCLVVIGQHVTNLSFLKVLLSQEQPLTPAEEIYHRILLYESHEAMDVIENYLKKNSLLSFYDKVLIPIITQTEIDFNLELIDSEKKKDVYQNIREIIEFLSTSESEEKKLLTESKKGTVLCLPAHAIRDEIAASILAQLLNRESFEAPHTVRQSVMDTLKMLEESKPDIVFITVVAPFVFSHTRYFCNMIHQQMPQLPIFIGLFGFSEVSAEILDKLNSAGASKIVFSLDEAIKEIRGMGTVPDKFGAGFENWGQFRKNA